MFKLLVSKTLSRSSIAFLLCGPGIVVRTVGLSGSFGKYNSSETICSGTFAAATLAAGLVVAVMGRMAGRRVRGRRRDDARRKVAIMASVQFAVLKQ